MLDLNVLVSVLDIGPPVAKHFVSQINVFQTLSNMPHSHIVWPLTECKYLQLGELILIFFLLFVPPTISLCP